MQLLLERLEKLEKKYGHPNPMYDLKYETDILDQRGFVHKICSARKDLSFLGITSLMKQRVSFFGIYSLTENVDLTHAKVEYLKK
jgi:repressor of nif and glnA expression